MSEYVGPERRSGYPRLRESLRANPALGLLLAFNILLTALVVTSLKAERDFERREKIETEADLKRTGEVLLYFCEEIEAHRAVSHAAFVRNAQVHGYEVGDIVAMGELAAPVDEADAKNRCARFRPSDG